MMYKLVFLPIAQQDMISIVRYIGINLQNPVAASKLADKMIEEAKKLVDMPYKCALYIPVKPLKHDYRKLIVGNYIMFYWTDEDKKLVNIARVIYGKRNYDSLLK